MAEQIVPAGATSVLDMMAAQIMGTKTKAAQKAKLTPVAGETPSIIPTVLPNATFPNDGPTQELAAALLEIERQLTRIQQSVDAVRAAMGVSADAPELAPEVTQKEREREGDERAAERVAAVLAEKAAEVEAKDKEALGERMARLAREAQDATFTRRADEPAADGKWVCPEHGSGVDATTRKNRAYRKCPTDGCTQFQPAA